jgi:8-oxo-dGTP pyrophosphatase MutT (NUDIX family)
LSFKPLLRYGEPALLTDVDSDTSPPPSSARLAATTDFPRRLALAALKPLPGRAAHQKFEPPWGFGRHYGPPPHDAVPAAVLVLLYPVAGRVVVPLTLRPTALSSHGGQISLPGGRIDAGESDCDAALRELWEELGVASVEVTPLAPLSPLYIFASRFHVRPWLAWCERRPTFVVNEREVAALLEVPLDDLGDSQYFGEHRRVIRGVETEVPHLAVGGQRVWGATAMILAELVVLCEQMPAAAETTT